MKNTIPLWSPFLTLLLSASLNAATYTWSGGSASNAGWNNAANWANNAVPTFDNQADLVWHSLGAARLGAGENAIVNAITIRSLTFNDNADSDIALRLTNGSGGTVGRTLTFNANTGNASINVDAGAAGNITIGAAGPGAGSAVQISLGSNLDINHHGSGLLLLDKIVGGTGAIHKTGTGTLRLSAANEYAGGTTISGGTIQANHNSALGSGSATIQANGTLLVASTVTLSSTPIRLSGGTLSRAVSSGGSYSAGTSGAVTSLLTDGVNTGVNILQSQAASSASTVSFRFSGTSTAANDALRDSDVLSLGGIASGDLYVLQLSIGAGVTSESFLGWFDSGANEWVNAVSGNIGGTANFIGDTAYSGAYFALGNWGIDTSAGTAWAVLNHQGDFAVVAIPEPATAGLLGLTLGSAFLLKRRKARSIINLQHD